jgi:hypothetical protein
MSDLEREIRRALKGMLDPVEPVRSLPGNTVRRAKVRRFLSAAIAGSLVVLVIAATSWAVIAIRQGALEDSPRVGGSSPAPDEAAPPRLYLAGDGELWMVDLAGRARHVKLPELSPGDPPYRIVRRGERLVAWGYETYLLDPELESQPQVLINDSLFFIPSSRDDRVWVGIPDSDSQEGGLEAVREVSVNGQVTVPDVRPPDGKWPERSLDDGLVFTEEGQKIVWDPVTEDVVFRFEAGDLGPTHGNLIAWCNASCESVNITDVATGSQMTVEPPPGFAAFDVWAGMFSPDGTTLALPVRRDVRDIDDAGSEVQLGLVDVTDGTARVVEGSNVRDGYNFVAWTSSGEHVFFTGGVRFEDRSIVVYRMGDESAQLLQVNVGDFFGAAAL